MVVHNFNMPNTRVPVDSSSQRRLHEIKTWISNYIHVSVGWSLSFMTQMHWQCDETAVEIRKLITNYISRTLFKDDLGCISAFQLPDEKRDDVKSFTGTNVLL